MYCARITPVRFSSIFDYTTYFVMLYLFGCWDPSRAPVFQTGWFVESLITQTLIIHVIRTKKIPFLHGRASWPLTITTGRDYLHWHVAPVLAPGRYFGLHAFATAVLANPFRYPALLRYPYSNRENVADAQVLAINCRNLNVPEATVDAVFRLWYIRKQL